MELPCKLLQCHVLIMILDITHDIHYPLLTAFLYIFALCHFISRGNQRGNGTLDDILVNSHAPVHFTVA